MTEDIEAALVDEPPATDPADELPGVPAPDPQPAAPGKTLTELYAGIFSDVYDTLRVHGPATGGQRNQQMMKAADIAAVIFQVGINLRAAPDQFAGGQE